jgi:hypothetical protein
MGKTKRIKGNNRKLEQSLGTKKKIYNHRDPGASLCVTERRSRSRATDVQSRNSYRARFPIDLPLFSSKYEDNNARHCGQSL